MEKKEYLPHIAEVIRLRGKFSFVPSIPGNHTFKLTVFTDHVKDVYIAIVDKRN